MIWLTVLSMAETNPAMMQRLEDTSATVSGGIRPATRLALACAAVCAASWVAGAGWDWDGYWLGKPARWWAAFGVVLPAMLALAAWTQYVVKPRFTTRRDWPLAVLSFTVVRLALAATFPIYLDEAYQWQWAFNLAWCYPDHPGAAGWLGALPAYLFGNRLIAGRLMPVLCGSALICLIHALAHRLAPTGAAEASQDRAAAAYSPHQVAAAAGALAMITPLGAILTMAISTDYPLALVWAAAPLLLYRALRRRSLLSWALLGLCLGFGLNTKFLSVGLVAPVVLFLALDGLCLRVTRRTAGSGDQAAGLKGPLLMLLVVAGSTAPMLYWNACHGWMTFLLHFSRRFEVRSGATGNILAWCAGQLAIVSPMVWVAAVVVGGACGLRVVRELRAGRYHRLEFMILCLTMAPLAGYAAMSLVTRVAANWAGSLYSPLLALLVVRLLAAPAVPKRPPSRPGMLDHCGGIAFVTTMVLLVPLFALPLVSEAAFRAVLGRFRDPPRVERLVAEYLGWPAVAREMDALWAQAPEARRPFLITWIYHDAAVLHFHLRQAPWVYVFNWDFPYGQGYQVWRDLEAERGRDALWVSRGPEAEWHLAAMRLCFDSVERVQDNERISPPGSPARAFQIYRGRNFKGRRHLPDMDTLSRTLRAGGP
jgi:hypothetical protein